MKIKRRRLLRNTLASLVGFGLTRTGIKAVHSQESSILISDSDLKQGDFFKQVLYPDPSFKLIYDRFVNQGFKFETDSFESKKLRNASNDVFLFTRLVGKRLKNSNSVAENVLISTIYTNKTLFDLGAVTLAYSTKNSQVEAVNFQLPNAKKNVYNQFDRKFILEKTPAELAKKILDIVKESYGENPSTGSLVPFSTIFPGLDRSGLNIPRLASMLIVLTKQVTPSLKHPSIASDVQYLQKIDQIFLTLKSVHSI